MKPRMKILLFACYIAFSLQAGCQSKQEFSEKLWFEKPAEDWFEALPLGNGRLGAMVFGDVNAEHLQLNEESLWAGCPEDPYPEDVQIHYPKFQQLNLDGKFEEAYEYAMKNLVAHPTSIRSYQPFGDLRLQFDHKKTDDYKRELDLASAMATVEYDVKGKRFKRETFISVEQDVLIYRFESLDNEQVNCAISFDREKDIVIEEYDDGLMIKGQIFDDPNGYDDNKGGSGEGGYHMKFAGLVKVILDDGESNFTNSSLQVKGSSGFTLIFGATTNYDLQKLNFGDHVNHIGKMKEQVKNASQVGYRELRQMHIAQSSSMYNRVKLDISGLEQDVIPTDQRIENLKKGKQDPYLAQLIFQYGRYLLLHSSGGKAVLPANLQGIWNQDMWAAWESDFHLNINLQMNYWSADVCNLSETMRPLSDFMKLLAERGTITAGKYIQSDGWIAHHVTNPFGRTTPSGSTPESQVVNGYSYPLAGTWMSMTLWRHYEFTQDMDYLKEVAYPVLHGSARFLLDFLQEDKNGNLVTAPSYSPENTYIHPVSGKQLKNTVAASIDIQIVRDIFKACLTSEELLSQNVLSTEIEEALTKLPPIKIGKDGTIQEWMEDYEEAEPGHRHISHLYALHPSNQINASNAELMTAATKTLEKRLSYGGGQTGWSRAWMVNFYARLLDGDECEMHINELLKNQMTNNLFDLHPPHIFQIDGNLGVTAGIAEMLIQSHEPGIIRLLPALPDNWHKGELNGLKARGNFEVSMQWENGKLLNAEIIAISGGKVKVYYDGEFIDVDLKQGQTKSLKFN